MPEYLGDDGSLIPRSRAQSNVIYKEKERSMSGSASDENPSNRKYSDNSPNVSRNELEPIEETKNGTTGKIFEGRFFSDLVY